MKLKIAGRLPTLNKYIETERANKFAAAKMKKDFTELVAWEAKSCSLIKGPADYTFTWTVPNKRSDPDNIAFACKFVFDGLVMAGKLPNDNLRYVRSITHFFEIGEPRVQVDIEEA